MWPCSRLVANGWATLEEVQRTMSVRDVLELNETLDAWLDAQRKANQPAPK
jgi:hypothetical protein